MGDTITPLGCGEMQRPSVSLSYPAFMALSPDDASSPSEDHFSPIPALEAGMNPRMDMETPPWGFCSNYRERSICFSGDLPG